MCIALPDAGREALRAVDPEEHFTSPLVRRAVLHLRDRVATPLADLPEEDPELVALISELVVRAGVGAGVGRPRSTSRSSSWSTRAWSGRSEARSRGTSPTW